MKNGMGTASLVLGILSAILFVTLIGPVLGILAIVFGSVGRGRAQRNLASNGGVATAGLVLGIIALVLFAVWFVFMIL